ncbi:MULTISPECIES: Ku protein [unclassified Streptomyces]|uniref:Ku protein n=1 Tax=unclassified Streptomyces TaxID=2593676 RepID=UPI0040438800
MPINVVGATEDHSVRFHQYHLADQGRICYRKVCELEDRVVSQDEIGKGYELTRTQVIPITDEDLSNLPLPTVKAIEIDAFVPLESIDPIRIAEATTCSPPTRSRPSRTSSSSRPSAARPRWPSRSRAVGRDWACSASATKS